MRNLILLGAVIFMIASCKNSSTPPGQESSGDNLMKVGKGKYAIKSGIVEYTAKVMGFEAKMTTWFDDYGGKEATETAIEMMGQKSITMSVTKDGWVYNFDPVAKTGTKIALSSKKDNIDFENLTEDFMKEMKIEKVGNEDCNGKPCVKYSINNDALQMKGFYWVYKGIAMKTDVEMATIKMLMDAVKVDENVSVPAEKF